MLRQANNSVQYDLRRLHEGGKKMKSGRFSAALALTTLAAALMGISSVATPVARAQDEPGGLIRVVHGLRGLVADIYLDGTLALPTFQPERSTDPLAIPAGDHLIEIRSAGAAMTAEPLLTQTVTVPSGFEGSLVAHLGPNGAPTLSVFADDLTPVPAGTSRLVVRHTAAAEGVNVLLNAKAALTGVEALKEASQVVPSGPYEIEVTGFAGGAPLAPPQNVEYPDGTANFMYLIGSQADSTLGWAAVQIANLETAPSRIQTGDGSTVPASSDHRGTIALFAVMALAAGAVVVRSRSRQLAG
jgi:uncharacterized protein DUF4397